jgi:two-component system phosphate regulon response regulator OmpR
MLPDVAPRRLSCLLVEDDARLAELLVEYLGNAELDVKVAPDGERGLELATRARARWDVILLDIMLPKLDGLELCRRLRARRELAAVPILMLTAKGDDVDKIVGLELGADDYLAKPFNPRELLARIRAVLRRAAPAAGEHFRTGELEIDFAAREVFRGGQRLSLTHHEFELLAQLARAAGRVLSRDQLKAALSGEEWESFDRSVDVHVSKLRGKIEPDPKDPRYVKTVRGVGYVLVRQEVR